VNPRGPSKLFTLHSRILVTGIGLLLLYCIPSRSQNSCFSGNRAFGHGEEISYQISYNWGPILVDCGKVWFHAEQAEYKGQMLWHLKVSGQTFPGYDAFFKVRDYYDTWVRPESFEPVEFHRYIYEGGYSLQNSLTFDQKNILVISNTKRQDHPLTTDTLRPGPCTFDMLSSVYYVRTIDFNKAETGVNYPVKVIIDDTLYTVTYRKVGRENMTDRSGKVYDCLKVATHMVSGTVFKGGEDVMVWLTNDENKIPVYIEAKIIVGSVKAYLKDYKGLLRPIVNMNH
jgi:hypothetical protein